MPVPKMILPHPRGRGWTFNQHKQHINPSTKRPYLGGDDLERAYGQSVKSPCDAWATNLGGGVIKLVPDEGGKPIYVRELGRLSGRYPRHVDALDTLADAGTKWPHYDTTDSFGRRASIIPRIAAYSLQVSVAAAKRALKKAENRRLASYLNQRGFTKTPTETTGVRGLSYWNGIRAWGRSHGLAGKRGRVIEAALIEKLK